MNLFRRLPLCNILTENMSFWTFLKERYYRQMVYSNIFRSNIVTEVNIQKLPYRFSKSIRCIKITLSFLLFITLFFFFFTKTKPSTPGSPIYRGRNKITPRSWTNDFHLSLRWSLSCFIPCLAPCPCPGVALVLPCLA